MAKKTQASKKNSRRGGKKLNVMIVIGPLLIILISVVLFILIGNGGKQAAPDAFPMEISVTQAYEKYQEDVFFLDVREQSEWDSFHIPNTTLIPLGELQNRLGELPDGQPIVVVCRSGNRSQAGRDTLLNAGFENVTSMAGGVTQWSNLGYPIEGTRP